MLSKQGLPTGDQQLPETATAWVCWKGWKFLAHIDVKSDLGSICYICDTNREEKGVVVQSHHYFNFTQPPETATLYCITEYLSLKCINGDQNRPWKQHLVIKWSDWWPRKSLACFQQEIWLKMQGHFYFIKMGFSLFFALGPQLRAANVFLPDPARHWPVWFQVEVWSFSPATEKYYQRAVV